MLIYEIVTAVLVVCAALMAMSPETMPRRRGAMASLRPRLQVPTGSGQLLLAAGAASVATWSLGGFYQAFGPSVVAEHLGTTNPLVAAAVFASVMVLNPLGGPLSGRLPPATGLRAGMTLFVLALGGILVSLHAGAIVPFIAASLVVGVAQGAASTGGMRALLTDAQPEERAGLLSTIYLDLLQRCRDPRHDRGQADEHVRPVADRGRVRRTRHRRHHRRHARRTQPGPGAVHRSGARSSRAIALTFSPAAQAGAAA